MLGEGYDNARKLAHWKHKIRQAWDQISVDSLKVPDVNKGFIKFGEHFTAEISLNQPPISPHLGGLFFDWGGLPPPPPRRERGFHTRQQQ